MNDAHFHLIVNHLPIIFPLAAVIVMISGLFFKSEAVIRSAYMLFVIGALSAVAAMTTGEGAEEIVENLPGVTEQYIEAHEDAAKLFAVLSYILGGLSLFGLWSSFKQMTFSNALKYITLVFAFVVLFFAKEAGTTGGEIRHTEIRSEYVSPPADNNMEKDED